MSMEERDTASDQLAALQLAATNLVQVMETCHICGGSLIVEGGPIHCYNCSSDCDEHDGESCVTLTILHWQMKQAIAGGTAALEAHDAKLNAAWGCKFTKSLDVHGELIEEARAQLRQIVEQFGKEGETAVGVAERLHQERLTVLELLAEKVHEHEVKLAQLQQLHSKQQAENRKWVELAAYCERLKHRLTIMVREWKEVVGDSEHNSTPGDVLEKAEAVLAEQLADSLDALKDEVRRETLEEAADEIRLQRSTRGKGVLPLNPTGFEQWLRDRAQAGKEN